jgi:hypothetical protein
MIDTPLWSVINHHGRVQAGYPLFSEVPKTPNNWRSVKLELPVITIEERVFDVI